MGHHRHIYHCVSHLPAAYRSTSNMPYKTYVTQEVPFSAINPTRAACYQTIQLHYKVTLPQLLL